MIKQFFSRMLGKTADEPNQLLNGQERPPNIPENWIGEALPEHQGWSWTNPDNRSDCVRIYAGDEPFVIVTRDGMVIGPDGEPTGERLDD